MTQKTSSVDAERLHVSSQVLLRREDEEVFRVFLLAGEVDVKITQAE